MKKIFSSIMICGALFMISCSGSDTYRGAWKGLSPDGQKVDIVFEAKKFTITDSTKKSIAMEYSQNSVNIQNGVETYGIQVDDGRGYQIKFPIAKDESVGLVMDENGNIMYTIGRKDYFSY